MRFATLALLGLIVACSSSGSSFTTPPDATDESSPDDDANVLLPPYDGSADTYVQPPVLGRVIGKVVAPEGTIPISGALVYITNAPPPPIPATNYCDGCVQLTQNDDYVLTNPDGTFDLPVHNIGGLNMVVQKGGFRRVSFVTLVSGPNAAKLADTTLPNKTTTSGDTVPSIVVMDPDYDAIQDALTKFGLVEGVGFTRYTNPWVSLLTDAKSLSAYHIVFLPCSDTRWMDKDPTTSGVASTLQAFVAAGGRAYITDYSYDYMTQIWPPYVNIDGESATVGSGWRPEEDRPATVKDPGLAAWLKAQSINKWTAVGSWTQIDKVNAVATTDLDGGPTTVTPEVWVNGLGVTGTKPMTVSFPATCGKVMFSTYHTEGNGSSGSLTPQELSLLYILLEATVCTASSTGVIVTPN